MLIKEGKGLLQEFDRVKAITFLGDQSRANVLQPSCWTLRLMREQSIGDAKATTGREAGDEFRWISNCPSHTHHGQTQVTQKYF